MNKRVIQTCTVILFLGTSLTWSTKSVQAKLLPRYAQAGSSIAAPAARSYSSVSVTPRFLPARNGLRVSFAGLNNAKSVVYMLSYETNGRPEGVRGTISPSEGSTTRELLFGTCSTNVCVNHSSIKNMKLEVTSVLTSGKTSIKRYAIRV